MKVEGDSVVELDFTVRILPEGEVVESTHGRETMVVRMGCFDVAPGLEQALLGMGVGEEKSIVIGPSDGYGPVRPEAIYRRRRAEFPPGAELKPGMRLSARLKDSDRRVEFGIREVAGDEVVVDFNHPYAGRQLRYWLLVRSVRTQTAAEREETHHLLEQRGAPPMSASGDTGTEDTARVSVEDVMRLGLRAGRVVEAARVEGTDRLLRVTVDLGSETRTIVAGIAAKYAPETLVGRSVVVVANLKRANIRGVESNGMLLAAVGEGGQPIIATFDEPVDPGAQVR